MEKCYVYVEKWKQKRKNKEGFVRKTPNKIVKNQTYKYQNDC